jgi:hypothetical protein
MACTSEDRFGSNSVLGRSQLNVRITPESGLKSDIVTCPRSADCVAKVSAEKLWNRNLKQSNRSARFSESTLRTSA